MSFTIHCPICGRRDLYEFHFGTEDRGPAPAQANLTQADYADKVLMHQATAGPQKEWWCHSSGCGVWFSIWRDTLTGRETVDPATPPQPAQPEEGGKN